MNRHLSPWNTADAVMHNTFGLQRRSGQGRVHRVAAALRRQQLGPLGNGVELPPRLHGHLRLSPAAVPAAAAQGPDPIELQYTGPMSPAQKMQALKRHLESIPVKSGSLVRNDHGGDGKVKSDGPWILAFRWMRGSDFSNPTHTIPDAKFDGDDKMTELARKNSGMKHVRDQVVKQFTETGEKSGKDRYSVTRNRDGSEKSKAQMTQSYVAELGGLLIGKENREAQGVLGSHDVTYDIVKSKGNEFTVEYRVRTDIDNESFVPGHSPGQKIFNYLPQKTGGYFAGYRVDIRWSETMYK